MNGQIVAILENRLGAQMVELVRKRGGQPLHAPALSEVPDLDPAFIARLITAWEAAPVKVVVFQTGVGTRALFKASDELGLTARLLTLLSASTVLVRGPKPTGALNSRGVRIDLTAGDPYTTAEIITLLSALPLHGERVVVQRYGGKNLELEAWLQAQGATVLEIPVYRWSMPEDTAPLAALIAALGESRVAAVVFTSASQVHNLFAFAQQQNAAATASTASTAITTLVEHLNASKVVSIGPVCSVALRQYGVQPQVEANPPKLGPLMSALDAALA